MAKTDSFFIRGSVNTTTTSYNEATLDIGAFVDPLQKAILKIHNVEWKIDDEGGGPSTNLALSANTDVRVCYQLTTQSQTATVDLSNKAVVASGVLFLCNNSGTDNQCTFVSDRQDVGPQSWRNGVLIGVENLYIGTDLSNTITTGDMTISMVAECTMETLTKEAAVSLALSQQ